MHEKGRYEMKITITKSDRDEIRTDTEGTRGQILFTSKEKIFRGVEEIQKRFPDIKEFEVVDGAPAE